MTDAPLDQPGKNETPIGVRSLRDLIDRVSGRALRPLSDEGDSGVAERLPFPFLAMVGQAEMKIALLLALINPGVGGVLLIGPRGTGKTTAVRSVVDLLPEVPRSLCYFGCMPEDIELGGLEAVCPDCAKKYGQGEPLAKMDRSRLVELPLNARIEDVVGSIDERAASQERLRIRRGVLSHADRNLLYVDEVNLLADDIVNAILDAAAQGSYTVRRGLLAATYRSRFALIGSMNPEEGRLRPQILDRFGLRVVVRGLPNRQERWEAYERVRTYLMHPRHVIADYAEETELARAEIQLARDILPGVTIPDDVAQTGLTLVQEMRIDSLRAEINMFEAARAYAAIDGRHTVSPADLRQVAPLALRLRRSTFMNEYFDTQASEEQELNSLLEKHLAVIPPSNNE
jgi:magnesium chelatase subunit I